MSEQHTPGRLTVTHNSWETSTIYCEGKEVARVHMDSEAHEDDEQHCENARRLVACWNACDGISTEHLENNARLIAAAPDLLEALRMTAQALDWLAHGKCRGFHPGLPTADESLDAARAAIAKATGEAK